MDFVLRGTFEWRELANLMASFRHPLPPFRTGTCESALAETVYRSGLALAHRSRPFARHLVKLLACVHGGPIDDVRRVERPALQARTVNPPRAEDVGLYWALLSDPREDVAALAHEWSRRAPQRGS
jgi:hypothetical protein